MRALVTGATGFLGSWIVQQLRARGDHVRVYARRRTPELEQLGVEWVLGDLAQPDAVAAACQGVEAVFHVAGIAGIWGPWKLYYGVNTLGTQYVVAGCLRHGVERLVFTSSPSVTFDGSPQAGIDESVPYPTRWLCHYPLSKALAEAHVLAANGTQRLRTCSLRPHLIWGPGDRHLLPRLLKRARRGQLRQVGDGTNWVDTVYVENAAAAHLLAAERLTPGSPVCGRAYFISQGQPVNCWKWINEILALGGLPPVRRRIPFRAAWLAGHLLETVYSLLRIRSEPRMTRFLAAQLAHSHYFNIQRAKQDLGYRAVVSNEEGMRRLKAWLDGQPGGAPCV